MVRLWIYLKEEFVKEEFLKNILMDLLGVYVTERQVWPEEKTLA